VERLRTHFEFMASRYAGFGYNRGCLIGNLAAETSDNMPLIRQALSESLKRWTDLVAATLREGQADGSIIADFDPERIARFLINSWEGAVVRMKIANSSEPLNDFFSIAFPLLEATEPRVRTLRKSPVKRPAGKGRSGGSAV
jgi:TetR/AcrR family transcriptional repressor of nem operon